MSDKTMQEMKAADPEEDRCVTCNAPAIGICESCEAPICDKHEGGEYEDVYQCADEAACSARIDARSQASERDAQVTA